MCKPAVLAFLAVVAGACEADTVSRTVSLEPDLSLPEGSSAILGDTAAIEFAGVEALDEATRFVVWADTESGPVALIDSRASGRLSVELADLGLTPGELQRIWVSEEAAGASLPAVPKSPAFLAGIPGGELNFASFDASAFAHATATADLRNETLQMRAADLPVLPAGYSYAVWLMFGPHPEGDAEHEEPEAPESTHMGPLDADGMLESRGDGLLGSASSVSVTVESVNGVTSMSTTRVLAGEVVFDVDGEADDEESDDHSH